MKAQVYICTEGRPNRKGGRMLTTRWSLGEREFASLEQARTYARGVAVGAYMKWQRAATALEWRNASGSSFTEYFYPEP